MQKRFLVSSLSFQKAPTLSSQKKKKGAPLRCGLDTTNALFTRCGWLRKGDARERERRRKWGIEKTLSERGKGKRMDGSERERV